MRNVQNKLFPLKWSLQYGGILRNKARNRGARPLSRKDSLHFVLRSSKAKGLWSFQHSKNKSKVGQFIQDFSKKKGVQILSLANVGNHLHLHVRITNRTLYKAWVRGLTSAIAMMIAGRKALRQLKESKQRFWDYRPFTRVVSSLKAFLTLKDYVEINQFEGLGMPRTQAVLLIKGSKAFFKNSG
jgi:REP element-mobilizing transposase RayT